MLVSQNIESSHFYYCPHVNPKGIVLLTLSICSLGTQIKDLDVYEWKKT